MQSSWRALWRFLPWQLAAFVALAPLEGKTATSWTVGRQQSDPLGWSGHTDVYGYTKASPLSYVDLNGEAYKRPGRTSNRQQKDAMQGQPCSTCGAVGQKNFADRKTPLVVEYCFTGSVDRKKMFEMDSVRPQCQKCSCSQGGKLRALYAKLKKCFPGL